MPSWIRHLQLKMQRKAFRKRLLRFGLLAANGLVLLAVLAFLLVGRGADAPGKTTSSMSLAKATQKDQVINPLDQVSAVDIAQTASIMTALPETPYINGQVVAEKVMANSQVNTAAAVIPKPEVIGTAPKSNKDIKTYVVQRGDTVSSIAAKFGLQTNSIRWSNGLDGDNVSAGSSLKIPPVDGIVYVVKGGDTVNSIAQAYSIGADLITVSNDAEIKGIHPGEVLLLPGAKKPYVPSYYGSFGAGYSYGSAFGTAYGSYNLYDYNNCTWWVAKRWAEIGRTNMPLLGNASQWYYTAARVGLPHGTTPRTHAAAVTSTYGYGHVVFVEGVNADGSINISEMNVDGRATSRVWYSTVPASTANHYLYIY